MQYRDPLEIDCKRRLFDDSEYNLCPFFVYDSQAPKVTREQELVDPNLQMKTRESIAKFKKYISPERHEKVYSFSRVITDLFYEKTGFELADINYTYEIVSPRGNQDNDVFFRFMILCTEESQGYLDMIQHRLINARGVCLVNGPINPKYIRGYVDFHTEADISRVHRVFDIDLAITDLQHVDHVWDSLYESNTQDIDVIVQVPSVDEQDLPGYEWDMGYMKKTESRTYSGGNLLIKVGDTCSDSTVKSIWMIAQKFARITFFKPVLCDPCSHDKYIICLDYRPREEDMSMSVQFVDWIKNANDSYCSGIINSISECFSIADDDYIPNYYVNRAPVLLELPHRMRQ